MDNDKRKAAYQYINEHQKNSYDRITILRPKGDKTALNKIISEKGYNSINQFINECINEKLKRMKVDINDYRPKKSDPDTSGIDPGD